MDVRLTLCEFQSFVGLAVQGRLSIELLGALLGERESLLSIVARMQMKIRLVL